jgi:bifunctional non-homologous end joining protein LigD
MKYLPMLAELGTKEDLTRKNFIYEPKFDGIRAILYKNKELKFVNRKGKDITHRYPELKVSNEIKSKSCVLDGEIIIYGKNKIPDFNLLQHREQLEQKDLILQRSKNNPATFVVFDIMEKDGKNLTNLPLKERRKILNQIITNSARLEKVTSSTNGKSLYKKMAEKHFEGVMAKDYLGKYYAGKRKKEWLKVKFLKSMDVVIVGYTSGKRNISAILTAVYHDNKLMFTGKVGTGFTQSSLKKLQQKFNAVETNTPQIPSMKSKNIHWLKPRLVAEIKFMKLTNDNIMRIPAFLRIRTDRTPKSCTLKQNVYG